MHKNNNKNKTKTKLINKRQQKPLRSVKKVKSECAQKQFVWKHKKNVNSHSSEMKTKPRINKFC